MEIKNEIMEFVGLMLGDGHISGSKNTYGVFIYGDAEEEKDYLGRHVHLLLNKTFGLNSKYWVRTSYKNGIKASILQLFNKQFVLYLTNQLGLSKGLKVYTVKIPENLVNLSNINYLIRGFFDTDGCLYFSYSKKLNYPTYPRIELRTVSEVLANQLLQILIRLGFEARKRMTGTTFVIYISGEKEIIRWMQIIGSSNKKHITKYLFWKKFGYHIPNIKMAERLKRMEQRDPGVEPGCFALQANT